jgi:hypothetical protein
MVSHWQQNLDVCCQAGTGRHDEILVVPLIFRGIGSTVMPCHDTTWGFQETNPKRPF